MLHSSATISQDVQTIYANSVGGVEEYFKKPQVLHTLLSMAGPALKPRHILGSLLFKTWRSILEFVYLTHAHTGDILLLVWLDAFGARYNIKMLSGCLDNNTLVDSSSLLVAPFRGPISVLDAFFSTALQEPNPQSVARAPNCGWADEDEEDADDILRPETDPDKQEHDDHVVKKVAQKALDQMTLEKVVQKRSSFKRDKRSCP
ncbi:hypothetical protein FRC10_007302, partial [Ceratobasidium sp. 414]